MAARELRYKYFENLRKDIRAQGICVAHHEDDNVETILLNIIRGTGLKGLTGMAPKNGFVIRPLLCITRSDITGYLSSLKQDYVTDSTNLVDDVKRNKIRLNLLPMLEEMNPSVKSNIAAMARYLIEAEKITEMSTNGFWRRKADIVTYLPDENAPFDASLDTSARIPVKQIMDFFSPEYLLYHILKNYGFNGVQIEQIYDEMNDAQGKTWQSASHELIIDRGDIVVERIKTEDSLCFKIPETGTYVFNDELKFTLTINEKTDSFQVSKDPFVATLDADKVAFPLTLRTVEQGDRFVPYGMKGSKLVSDFLTDNKLNIFEKRAQLVLVDATGIIIWLPGLRVSNKCAVSAKTKNILVCSR
jgi:tRNA(Ile)-lysidine synthase